MIWQFVRWRGVDEKEREGGAKLHPWKIVLLLSYIIRSQELDSQKRELVLVGLWRDLEFAVVVVYGTKGRT